MNLKFVNTQLLSDLELEFYKVNGFVAPVQSLFDLSDVIKIHELIKPLLKRTIAPGEMAEDMNLVNKCPDLLDFVLKDHVLDMIEKVIGPNIGLKESSAITKRAHSKTNFQWHSDFNYGEHQHELVKNDSVVLMLAVTPSTLNSGCVRFIPKTQSISLKRKHGVPEGCDAAVSVTLQKGFCSLHNVHILHSSDPNTSDEDRVLLTFRFFVTDVGSLNSEAIDYLKKTSIGKIHLRGSDDHNVCAHSVVKPT